jgi:biotin transport system permease protein
MTKKTWLHRQNPNHKLIFLLFASVALLNFNNLWGYFLLFVGVCLTFLTLGGAGRSRLAFNLKTAGLAAFFVGAIQFLFSLRETGYVTAAVTSTISILRLMTLILLADLISLTTPITDMISAIKKALQSLGRTGVRSIRLSLTIGLVIRAANLFRHHLECARDAAKARASKSTFFHSIPSSIRRSIKSGSQMADALHSRQLRSNTSSCAQSGKRDSGDQGV